MRNALVLVLCGSLAVVSHAGNTPSADRSGPVAKPLAPPANGTGASGAQAVEADIDANGTGSGYIALVLDYDGGDNLYVKVQQQDSSGMFSNIGFYHANNGGGWPGMTGGDAFFTLPTEEKFASGHVKLEHDGAGNVTLTTPKAVYTRGGWVPRNADGAGFGHWNGTAKLDNWGVGDGVCDDFNRADGPVGPDWSEVDGTAVIRSSECYQGTGPLSRIIRTADCGGPECHYTLKKSKAKGGCGACPAKGEEVGNGAACEDIQDCDKKFKGNIPCPDGGNGLCKIKGKRSSCG